LTNGSSPKSNASEPSKDHGNFLDEELKGRRHRQKKGNASEPFLGERVQVREPMTLPLIACGL
jgi:hypothetical protein